MILSPNFTLSEFIKSRTAKQYSIVEQYNPQDDIIDNLRELCKNVLQPIRDHIVNIYPHDSISIIISSGYRCEAVEKIICKSSYIAWCTKHNLAINEDSWDKYFKRKHHPQGYAADCNLYINGGERNDVFRNVLLEIAKDITFTQIIFERGKEDNPAWIHISYNKNDIRNQIFRIQ